MRDTANQKPIPATAADGTVTAVVPRPAADAAWNEIVIGGKNFWAAVHAPFMDRELTKSDVREIIRRATDVR